MTATDARKRRLFLLGDTRQVHLKRWAEYFVESDYEVIVFSLEGGERFPVKVYGTNIPAALPRLLRYPLAAPAARALARRYPPDIVNAHFVPNYGLIARMMARRPYVVSTWGSDVMVNAGRTPFHAWRARAVLRGADHVTSDATVMTERIVAFGVPGERVLTLPFGVDTSRFSPSPDVPAGGPRLVSNRRLETVYGVSTIVDAFAGVTEALPGATLTVAGDGSLRAELARRAGRSVAAPAITFVGSVDHERMPVLLREHHIYVSSTRSDTTSVSLLEAMACGLFPVVSDIPANREWIRHRENGYLFPAGQPLKLAMALIEAWQDEELREAARKRNLEIIRTRATWSDNMAQVRELFEKLIAAAATR